MSLAVNFNSLVNYLLADTFLCHINKEQLIQVIDLTLLKKNLTSKDISKLLALATSNNIAAVCVFIEDIHHFATNKNSFNNATVINFPQGTLNETAILADIDKAMGAGANEIDYVFPYQSYLQEEKAYALQQCKTIAKYCEQNKLCLKIILETGAFLDMLSIYQLSKELLDTKCNYLKTSTGTITQGASLAAAFAIVSAIKDTGSSCGIKVSGGIKSVLQAKRYALLAELVLGKKIDKQWFRIGASSLLEELVK